MIRAQLIKAHPERDGDFRWRGDGVSRIEGLSDAVFGFALTLLVVSLEVPATFDNLAAMMLGLPAFAITFTLLILIWSAHYRFFRYGVFALMHALSRRVDLGLDSMEVLITRYATYEHVVMIAAGLLSAVVVLGLAYGLGVSTVVSGIVAGWMYGAIGPMQAVLGRRLAREKRALRPDVAPADDVAVAVAGA